MRRYRCLECKHEFEAEADDQGSDQGQGRAEGERRGEDFGCETLYVIQGRALERYEEMEDDLLGWDCPIVVDGPE